MENIDKYIGILHKFGGDTFDGCDCVGLCKLFYREHDWFPVWDDGKPITRDWQKNEPMRIVKFLTLHFKMTRNPDALRFGDILYFDIYGDTHLAIYLEGGDILSMQVPVKEGFTCSTIYHSHIWKRGFRAGFRRLANIG